MNFNCEPIATITKCEPGTAVNINREDSTITIRVFLVFGLSRVLVIPEVPRTPDVELVSEITGALEPEEKQNYSYTIACPVGTYPVPDADFPFLILLDQEVPTVAALKRIIGLGSAPVLFYALVYKYGRAVGITKLYRISKGQMMAIKNYLMLTYGMYIPKTIIRMPQAPKNLCPLSPDPFLGLLSVQEVSCMPFPAQDEYPVIYFFHGRLADPYYLRRVLSLDETPFLEYVMVNRGTLKRWNKHCVLTNGSKRDQVPGSMYLVKSKKEEDVLRLYATELYKVVRCEICRQDGSYVYGLTFRFSGDMGSDDGPKIYDWYGWDVLG
ncbi:MAG: hypothetical protein M1834_002985 [Cirrosporium novae-zelandiae]|nr:MAG: hypothetical protein M1834_002985 [Cirrosporium novae-zelandiae]